MTLQKTAVKQLLCLTLGILLASCGTAQKPSLRSDSQVMQFFATHQEQLNGLKATLLAEKQQDFIVQLKNQNYTVSPRSALVTLSAIDTSKKLMKEINADKITRSGSAVSIRVKLVEDADKIDEENIVFGDNPHPLDERGLHRDIVILGSGWSLVKDRIDLHASSINLK